MKKIDSHLISDVNDVRIIELPRHRHTNGSLSVVENGAEGIPFKVRRVYYIYDAPADAERGGHSHYAMESLMVALTGSFDVVLDDGVHPTRRFSLNRPYKALYIPAGLWRTVDNFSGGAVCLSLASERYDEADYVRDYSTFKSLTSPKSSQK